LCLARAATQPVCVQLDHAVTRVLVQEAADLGIPAVMFDGSVGDHRISRSMITRIRVL